MKRFAFARPGLLIPALLAVAALAALALWLGRGAGRPLARRVPGTDQGPSAELGSHANPVLAGKLIRSDGQPTNLPGAWPQWRGPDRDGISTETNSLKRTWQAASRRRA